MSRPARRQNTRYRQTRHSFSSSDMFVVVVVGSPFGSIDAMGLWRKKKKNKKKNSCALNCNNYNNLERNFFFFLWLMGLLMQTFTAQGVEKGAQSNIGERERDDNIPEKFFFFFGGCRLYSR